MSSRRARFVTFEGLDGSGKSTQLRRAASWLSDLGVPHVATFEPGGTALGERVRSLFLDPRLRPADGVVEALLLFASRRQHLHEVIEPALARGEHVLCDRFTDSTLAYQGAGRGLDPALLATLDALSTGERRPHLTLLFDVDVETAQRRRATGERGRDRLDEEVRAFHRRVRRGYLELAAREPDRVRVVDASGETETTALAVRALLTEAGVAARDTATSSKP